MRLNKLHIVLILLFGLNIILLVRVKTMSRHFYDAFQSYELEQIDDSIKNENLKVIIEGNYIGKINASDSLKKLVSKSEKIILFITEGNCGSCIDECLTYLADLGSTIGRDKILLLGNFHENNTFEIFKQNASTFIENSLFCPDLNLPEKFTQQPLLFVLDKNLNIRLLFVPDFYTEYIEEYFVKILPNYFSPS